MTLTVLCILLFVALLHVSWDVIVRTSSDRMYAAIDVSGSATLIALMMLPSAPRSVLANAPYLLAPCALRMVYTVLVAKIYQVPDMSQIYPLMRGTTPLLVAATNAIFLGDHLSPLTWLSVGVIYLVVPAIAFHGHVSSRKGIVLALINTCSIAGYTLMDGTDVRLTGSTLGHTLWIFFMNGFYLLYWATVTRRREASRYLRQHWKKGILGGVGTMGSRGLAPQAMTQTSLVVIVTSRETSILLGALIILIALKEQLMPLRIVTACGIAAGAISLRLV